ncbi:MAG TPA: hypothetical protein DCM28_02715 [Phycisphaerales bacterium]|nr:hypothetical protein [Phycisphaerales bacterium]HCD35151.1 hypothetical protein [Phycisphaerales bacterium]|tara:strand:- start:799 stop:2454 length:1656 start_codon:yes stop_codon:yes gene_type:complete
MSELSHNTNPVHVLVMDQDMEAQDQIADLLTSQGFVASAVTDPQDAINELRFAKHNILIMDINDDREQILPLIQTVRQSTPHIQIILYTGHCSFEMAKEALNQGVFAYVDKSESLDVLRSTIHRAVHQYDALALDRSQMRFATIVNDLSDMVIRYLPDGTITFANRVFLDVYDLSTIQLSGRQITEFIQPSQPFDLPQLIEQFSEHNSVVTMDVKMKIPPSRESWFRWTNRAIYDDANELQEIQSALHDITDAIYSERYLLSRVALSSDQLDQTHKRLAQEIADHQMSQDRIRQRESELAHVARLNIMGEMASSIAHELNQPLAAIANYTRGCVKRLERLDEVPPAILQAMEAAARQSERAGQILRRLRDLVQKRSTHTQPTHLSHVFKEVMELLNPVIKNHGIQLQVINDLKSQLVHADVIQIQQVFINLIRNAVDAMKPIQHDKSTIKVHMYINDAKQVQVDIIDQGHGLGDVDTNHVFDMFVSTRSEGMGMGLAICRTIIESHGGQCVGKNHPHGGAIFSFTLPAYHPDDIEISSKLHTVKQNQKHIL